MTSADPPGWLVALAGRAGELHEPLARRLPPPAGGRRSAVLILFGPMRGLGGDVDVVLTQRSTTLRSHPGQVAFPGGAVDPQDASSVAAALREAAEETGLEPDGVEVLGTMPELFLPPSGFVVTPVLAWWRRPSAVRPVDRREVARVARAPLSELLDPANRFMVRHPSGYSGAGFSVRGLFVWGFTAGLLDRVLTEAGLEQPWDRNRFEPLPSMVDPADDSQLVSPDTVVPERGTA